MYIYVYDIRNNNTNDDDIYIYIYICIYDKLFDDIWSSIYGTNMMHEYIWEYSGASNELQTIFP